jgi:hypothetical protein
MYVERELWRIAVLYVVWTMLDNVCVQAQEHTSVFNFIASRRYPGLVPTFEECGFV